MVNHIHCLPLALEDQCCLLSLEVPAERDNSIKSDSFKSMHITLRMIGYSQIGHVLGPTLVGWLVGCYSKTNKDVDPGSCPTRLNLI